MHTVLVVAACGLSASSALAVVTPFVGNPTTNSVDFASAAAGLGLSINAGVDFESHPAGPLNGSFYAGSHGVTLTQSNAGSVYFGPGATNGTVTTPFSPGEGLRSGSFGAVLNTGANWTLTATFATPVAAAGFMTVDYFNPFGDNPMTIEAFTGPSGTGTSLGVFNAPGYSFQLNYTYFMGIVSTAGDIRSIRIGSLGQYGDGVFVDDVRFGVPVPAPAAAIGLLPLGVAAARRRR